MLELVSEGLDWIFDIIKLWTGISDYIKKKFVQLVQELYSKVILFITHNKKLICGIVVFIYTEKPMKCFWTFKNFISQKWNLYLLSKSQWIWIQFEQNRHGPWNLQFTAIRAVFYLEMAVSLIYPGSESWSQLMALACKIVFILSTKQQL